MTLLICRTCPRYDTRRTGAFSRDLTASLRSLPTADIAARYVQCLGGCPVDGVAALDAPGKTRIRFTGLHADHAEPLARAAHAHQTSPTGEPDEWALPAELHTHVSSITRKRHPSTATSEREPFREREQDPRESGTPSLTAAAQLPEPRVRVNRKPNRDKQA